MKMSTERVLTTHVGSFPPPADLFDAHIAEDAGADHDPVGLSLKVRSSVSEIVRKQSEVGVDIVSDGELSKSSYTDYVKHRQNGIGSGERGGGGRGSGGIRDIRDSPPCGAASRARHWAGPAPGGAAVRQGDLFDPQPQSPVDAAAAWAVEHLSRIAGPLLHNGRLIVGQKEAVKTILSSKDLVIGVQGYAGTGKTTMPDRARQFSGSCRPTPQPQLRSQSDARSIRNELTLTDRLIEQVYSVKREPDGGQITCFHSGAERGRHPGLSWRSPTSPSPGPARPPAGVTAQLAAPDIR